MERSSVTQQRKLVFPQIPLPAPISLSWCFLSAVRKAQYFHFQLICSFFNFYIPTQSSDLWPCLLLTVELHYWKFLLESWKLSRYWTDWLQLNMKNVFGNHIPIAQKLVFKNSLVTPLLLMLLTTKFVCVHVCAWVCINIERNTEDMYHRTSIFFFFSHGTMINSREK